LARAMRGAETAIMRMANTGRPTPVGNGKFRITPKAAGSTDRPRVYQFKEPAPHAKHGKYRLKDRRVWPVPLLIPSTHLTLACVELLHAAISIPTKLNCHGDGCAHLASVCGGLLASVRNPAYKPGDDVFPHVVLWC